MNSLFLVLGLHIVNVMFQDFIFCIPLISGLRALAATATPANIPPALVGTIMASRMGTCSRNSSAIVPWKKDLSSYTTDPFHYQCHQQCGMIIPSTFKAFSSYCRVILVIVIQMLLFVHI